MGQMKSHLLIHVSFLLFCLLNAVKSAPRCSGAFFSVSDCLDYVLEGSAVYPQQGGTCCTELASLVKHSRTCLCEAAVEATRLGIQINVSRALALLSVCKIVSAPIVHCDIAPPVSVAPWHASPPALPETTPSPSPSKAPNLAPENAPTCQPYLSPVPQSPLTLNPPPPPPPFLPNSNSPHSRSSEVLTGRKSCATYFHLIFTLFLLACL